MRRTAYPRFPARSAPPGSAGIRRAPGGPSSPAGKGAASFANPFISAHVPILWQALTREFGTVAEYWLDGDSTQTTALTVIWKEGAEDEAVSPGRYSRALVQNGDLPRPPAQGDAVSANGTIYDVVRVNAMTYQMSSVVLQDRQEES